MATCERTGYRAFECELHKARGELLLGRHPAEPAPPEDAFKTAIAIAKRQGLAATSCSRRLRSRSWPTTPLSSAVAEALAAVSKA